MLFACAHAALDPSLRALLLRVVLGVSADRIASAFLVSPVAMRQRLVRAKEKMRATGMSFDGTGTGASRRAAGRGARRDLRGLRLIVG